MTSLYYCLFAPHAYIFLLCIHHVRGESHNQCNTTREVAIVRIHWRIYFCSLSASERVLVLTRLVKLEAKCQTPTPTPTFPKLPFSTLTLVFKKFSHRQSLWHPKSNSYCYANEVWLSKVFQQSVEIVVHSKNSLFQQFQNKLCHFNRKTELSSVMQKLFYCTSGVEVRQKFHLGHRLWLLELLTVQLQLRVWHHLQTSEYWRLLHSHRLGAVFVTFSFVAWFLKEADWSRPMFCAKN